MPRFLYTFLLFLALPFVPFKLYWRGLKQPEYWQHWGERFGRYTQSPSAPVIWLHCVSVGETHAAAPLVKTLKHTYPDHQILMTHTTPTGRAASVQLFGSTVQRVYLPYDVPFAVRSFLKHFKPSIGLLMETELWFNLIAESKKSDVPLLLLNARLSEQSALGYKKLGRLVKNGLSNLSSVAAQTQADADRLQRLGANDVTIAGNLKFDVAPPTDSNNKGLALRKLFGDATLGKPRPIFLAASTREGEEALILEAIKGLDVLTVIVPRHPQRFDEVATLIDQQKVNYARRSTLTSRIANDTKVILGDSMGELFTYYAACDFTFVGGSLLNFGGQNLIEAAIMGKPVIIGEHTFNFAEASKNAIKSGAAIRISNVKQLRQQIEVLLQDVNQRESMGEAALTFSQSATGAADKMMVLIKSHIPK
ncbi:MAG: lipid IV(A) 3-deoxy-D-manno-octulosonic acid transferase [Methylophilaceae bacterium]